MVRVLGWLQFKRRAFRLMALVLIALSIKFSFPTASLESFASFSAESYSVLRDASFYGGTNISTFSSTFSRNFGTGNSSNISLGWTESVYAEVEFQGDTFDTSISIHLGQEVVGHVQNGKLVANVDENYLFWFDGSRKLCDLLRNMTLSSSIDGIHPVPPGLINVTMDCVDHAANRQGLGQGNWVTAVYSARMASALAGVDFQFHCKTGRQHQLTHLLPWFDQYQAAPSDRSIWPYSGPRPNQGEACPPKYPFLRIDHMASQMQDNLRKMAVTLVGSRDETRRHPEVPVDATPLIPNVVLDDVALHFRCGDVLGGAKRNDFGMIRFNEYKKWIPHDTPSIGILTQSFEAELNRGQDSRKADSCRQVVMTLVDYLRSFAPQARISIHNGINETLPLTYARLVMANYSITSLSSFGIFPVIATFGQGYFQRGNRGVNPFATYVPHYLENIHEMVAEVRGTGTMFGKPVEELIEWFLDDPTKEEVPVSATPVEESPVLTTATPEVQDVNASIAKNGAQQEGTSETDAVRTWNHEVFRSLKEDGGDATGSPVMVEEAVGHFHNGKLVVKVDETYLFWNDGARKLCRLLKNMTLAPTLFVDTQPVTVSSAVIVTMDCVDHARNRPGFGQGNWVTAVYSAKMATAVAGVDFKFQCTDGRDSQMELLLPWFDQYHPALTNRTVWPYEGGRPTEIEACAPKYPWLRIDHVASIIQDDVRRMAVTLVGTRDGIRSHPDIPSNAAPMIPDVQLDDVALHFRCGDVLGGARRGDFGMIRFNEYKKWIPKDTKSIGILTQPFEIENNRQQDRGKADSCRLVVYALVDYLSAFAPNAIISIRNGVNETLPLTYARLVMANISITSLSSFGIFPVIGTFGQGYFQQGNRGVNPFATYIPAYMDNIHEMQADWRTTASMMGQSVEDLIAWFVDDTAPAPS